MESISDFLFKICRKCEIEFPNTLEYFNKNHNCVNSSITVSLDTKCKNCEKTYRKIKKKNRTDNRIVNLLNFSETKQCKCCTEYFPRTEEFFHKCKEKLDGLKTECKKCRHRKGNEYSAKKRDSINKKSRENYSKLTEEEKRIKNTEKQKRKKERNPPKIKIDVNLSETRICTCCLNEFPQTSEFFYSKIKNEKKIFNAKCKKCASQKEFLRYREKRAALGLAVDRIKPKKEKIVKIKPSKEELRLKRNKRKAEYRRKRYKEDINFRLRMCCSSRIADALKRKTNQKFSKTIEMLGCTIDFLRKHIESQFLQGMSWENYGYGDGKFHIDHIIPCAAFDFSTDEIQKICFHWVNLRPEWHFANISKNNIMPNGKYVDECSQQELDFYINELKNKIAGVNLG